MRRVIRRSKSRDSGALGSLHAGSASSTQPGTAASPFIAGSGVGKGEIWIRVDGRGVHRVRKPRAKQPPTLEDFTPCTCDSETCDSEPVVGHSGSATVGACRMLDGETILSPDGEEVIRQSQSTCEANSNNNAKVPAMQSLAACKKNSTNQGRRRHALARDGLASQRCCTTVDEYEPCTWRNRYLGR